MASTETLTYNDNAASEYLSSSFSNLSRSRSTNSLIVRTYKQATQLYLTKRFKEALETLEPIVAPAGNDSQSYAQHGDVNGEGDATSNGPAPVAQSSKGTRTKVWVFYLSLLNAIVELVLDEGKLIFGSTKWKQLAAKVKEGSIWEEVVQRGYGGIEGEVDADVVINLATLLLDHMQDQKLNQQRLETYLSSSESVGANGHVSFAQDGTSTPMSAHSSSPKALNSRLKILELYTLHVLPANEEWDYARSFIEVNDVLDGEHKESFLNALQSLQEEKDGTAQRERELQEQREHELEQQRKEEAAAKEARRADQARKDAQKRKDAENEREKTSTNGNATAPAKASSQKSSSQAAPSRPSKPQKKPPSPPPDLYRRASSTLNNLQRLIMQAGKSLAGNSMSLLRFLMFVVAFLLILARRDLRLKLKRAIDDGWVKIKQTVGMGVKVSYL